MADKWTEEELDMLTDEERAGLEEDVDVDEDDDEGDEQDTGTADKASDPVDKTGETTDDAAGKADEDGDDTDPAIKTAKPAEAAAEPAGKDVAADDPDGGDGDEQPAQSASKSALPDWKAPVDADAQIAEIEAKKDELAAKFDDGELTAKEFREQLKPLEQQQAQISRQVLKAEMSYETAVETWKEQTVPSFLAKNPEYKPGTLRYRLLDAEVRDLQTQAGNKFDPAILAKAHEKIAAELGDGGTKKPAGKMPSDKKREIPPTLAGLPAADFTETEDGGDFAYLDRLADSDGVAFEAALAKLSDAQREQYLAA